MRHKIFAILLAAASTHLVGACQTATCADGLALIDGQCSNRDDGGTCGGCDAHEFCDTSATLDACTCVPGYSGDPCTFEGLVRDPGFQQIVDTGAWVNEDGKGAAVLPGELGNVDSGEGFLDDSVICNGGSLLQKIDMPSYALAEPLVVEVNYKAMGVHGLAVGFNRAWTRLPATDDIWTPARFCLGEAAYGSTPGGSEVKVRISASERLANCYQADPGSRIQIDSFVIVPANDGECLKPGSVRNGTIDTNGEEWRFLTEGLVDFGFAEGEGKEGDDGVHIAMAAGDEGRATMATRVSVPVPATLPSPALVFWWRGSSEHVFDVRLGTLVDLEDRGRQLDTLVGTDSGLTYIYCLPPWSYGNELDLSFSIDGGGPGGVELVVDEVMLTSDPDCGTKPDLLDPGFESAPNRWFGSRLASRRAASTMQVDNALARTGSGLLELSYEASDATLSMETYVLVPVSEEGRWPALTFYSLSPATIDANVESVLGLSEQETKAVELDANWSLNRVCLPRLWSGRWFRVQVRVQPPPFVTARERILLDDFSLGLSAFCSGE